ncbi:hypothetical protein [Anabaena sp. UHCC 0399]|nr:hypothetical protein [Anabaena sp. UHCC 0399]MEA5564965.1 hypothetical protein [Anabaena sp. UHCC 0399]
MLRSHILHRANGIRGYTDETRLRGLYEVRDGGLCLYSRDF